MFSKILTATALKCSLVFNMYGTREFCTKENFLDSSFPRCSETEDWGHVAKCRYSEEKINVCLRNLRSKLERTDDANEDSIKMNKIVSNISEFLKLNII